MAATPLSFLLAAAVFTGATGQDCPPTGEHIFACAGNWLGECNNGQWTPLINCADLGGQVCVVDKCTDENPDPTCDDNYCVTGGLFPDLTDCRNYQDCNIGTMESFCNRCPSGYAFDQCTRACSWPLGSGSCPHFNPPCQAAGKFGVAPDNHRLYYVCGSDLVPHWGECSSGFFNVATGRCTDWSTSGCTPCQRGPGVWPLPNTNCRYLYCSSTGPWEERGCSTGWHFDSFAGACVIGPCTQA